MLNRMFRTRRAEAAAPVQPATSANDDDRKRDEQENVKASAKCRAVFARCAKAQGISKAALFEDMVAERAEFLRKAGVVFLDKD